ncbi:MAG: hypothetical protein ACP5FY_09120 [Kosmotogaceae bacterium]
MRALCIAIIMTLLSTVALAVESEIESASGSIERITVSQVAYSEENGVMKPQKRETKRIEVFSEQGLPVITALHTNGKEYSRVEYTYDTAGLVLESRYYRNASANFTSKTQFSYDSSGRVIEEKTYDYWPPLLGPHRLVERVEITYELEGREILRVRTNQLGAVLSKTTLILDEDGRVMEESVFDGSNKLTSRVIYEYDDLRLSKIGSMNNLLSLNEETIINDVDFIFDRKINTLSGESVLQRLRRVSDGYFEIVEKRELGGEAEGNVRVSLPVEPFYVSREYSGSLRTAIWRSAEGDVVLFEAFCGDETLVIAEYSYDSTGLITSREYIAGELHLRIDYTFDSRGNWIEERLYKEESDEFRLLSAIERIIEYY